MQKKRDARGNLIRICHIVISKMHSNEVILFSYKQLKHDYSLLRAYAVSCETFNITVNRDYLHAQNQCKLASVCFKNSHLSLKLLCK